jgi:hypothetical protein
MANLASTYRNQPLVTDSSCGEIFEVFRSPEGTTSETAHAVEGVPAIFLQHPTGPEV